jgi:hypothetical protein
MTRKSEGKNINGQSSTKRTMAKTIARLTEITIKQPQTFCRISLLFIKAYTLSLRIINHHPEKPHGSDLVLNSARQGGMLKPRS